jgi:type VI secretion system secreted protein VgrG
MLKLEATQANQPIAVTSPLGDDVLLFHSMNVSEQLGRLFQFDLDLLSNDPEIKLQDIVGQNVTVRYLRPDGENRYFNGFVNQFSQAGAHGNLFVYRATLRPWFWFLTRSADCRIFQNKTVPDIIKEVFRDKGFSDFEDTLSGNYREWENCVQYRETDFNFVSRLMEQEGIYYYFAHEDGKHTLVLSDSINSHQTVPGYEEVSYYPAEESGHWEREHISDWSLNQIIQPGAYALNDYDFKKPRANLEVKSSMPRGHDQADFEIYDYPGEYKESSDGETYARARLEELQAQYEEVQGQGNVAGLMTGCLFKLTNYVREDQNREYLVTAANYSLGPQEYESGFAGGSGSIFSCSFTAIDKQQAFRAPRITPKPVVQGPQTAIVVGKAGEEIWTDKYGRVKVQFHWDRYGMEDENSSCWIRVSHPWAGKNWGAVAIPRIGHEVIVSFREGDPDQPIITGRVYNDDNMPPYELPANATQSGLKTRSSKEGTADNFNELRFEDKKGSEEVYIHAEKDQNNHVENDETIFVGHDRTMKVDNDLSDTITNNKTIDVGVNHTENIGGNMKLKIDGSQDIKVIGDKEEKITGNSVKGISGSSSTTISGSSSTTISGFVEEFKLVDTYTKTGGDTKEIFVGTKMSLFVGASTSNVVGVTHSSHVGSNFITNLSTSIEATKGPKFTYSEAKEVERTPIYEMDATASYDVDSPKITLKGGGSILLEVGGTKVEVTSGGVEITGKVNIKGNVSIEGNMMATKAVSGKNIACD